MYKRQTQGIIVTRHIYLAWNLENYLMNYLMIYSDTMKNPSGEEK